MESPYRLLTLQVRRTDFFVDRNLLELAMKYLPDGIEWGNYEVQPRNGRLHIHGILDRSKIDVSLQWHKQAIKELFSVGVAVTKCDYATQYEHLKQYINKGTSLEEHIKDEYDRHPFKYKNRIQH